MPTATLGDIYTIIERHKGRAPAASSAVQYCRPSDQELYHSHSAGKVVAKLLKFTYYPWLDSKSARISVQG